MNVQSLELLGLCDPSTNHYRLKNREVKHERQPTRQYELQLPLDAHVSYQNQVRSHQSQLHQLFQMKEGPVILLLSLGQR